MSGWSIVIYEFFLNTSSDTVRFRLTIAAGSENQTARKHGPKTTGLVIF